MEQALRNLQIFRNGALIIDTMDNVKSRIEHAVENGTLALHDGEPVSIRYKENAEGEVKGLFGVAYIQNGEKKVLWNAGGSANIYTEPEEDEYITLNHTADANGNVTLTLEYTKQSIATADEENDGLATALDVKNYIDGIEIVKLETAEENYISSYQLQRDGVAIGDTINIPKDFLVKSGECIEVTAGEDGSVVRPEDAPENYPTAAGKYLDFVINAKEGTASDEHMYVALADFITIHTQVEGEEGEALDNDELVKVIATTDETTKVVTLTSSVKTQTVADATEDEDGLATANDIREYVEAKQTVVEAADETITVTFKDNENGRITYKINANIPEVEDAVVERNVAADSLNVTAKGVLNQDAMAVIEKYIDNYDCGTFESTALNSNIAAAEAGTEVNVDNNINVADNEGTIVINSTSTQE